MYIFNIQYIHLYTLYNLGTTSSTCTCVLQKTILVLLSIDNKQHTLRVIVKSFLLNETLVSLVESCIGNLLMEKRLYGMLLYILNGLK